MSSNRVLASGRAGKPMAVQHHADIIAVSYEARELGVTKHMPIGFIHQQYPSVKLVHVQTMGLQNDKVSYRNYRQAARSIFTLIRAFCPAEGKDTAGKFQKTSVDEAYLEPGRRTLEAELILAQQEREGRDAADWTRQGVSLSKINAVKKRPKLMRTGLDMSHDATAAEIKNAEYVPSSLRVVAGVPRGTVDSSTCDSQQGLEDEDGEDGYLNSGARLAGWGGARDGERGGGGGREEEVNRFLNAGGLLATRIQREVREVLEYDCSVGVAENKFLAKLATNLAKPKGVRVLHRRDIPSVLASTPAVKIPGCGGGTVAARQFAEWGVKSVLDLRRVQASELRHRLGENLGVKVYDRCRGIDADPVEPNPEPSRVSSQLSLFPLIKPAHCLGKPNEKLIPVFPWEVDRLKAHVVTLVDDLLDRMTEELAERRRLPTKLATEYHIFKSGSKTRTFPLPLPPPRGCMVPPADASHDSSLSAAPDNPVDIPGLPAAATLVELALTPFKTYMRPGDGVTTQGGRNSTRGGSLPVVKLNVTLLGFKSVGKPGATDGSAAQQGQRTLSGMMWLGRDSDTTETTGETRDPSKNASERDHGPEISPIRPTVTPVAKDITTPLSACVTSPTQELSAASVTARAPGSVDTSANCTSSPPLGDEKKAPQLTGSSVLIRCPKCKACLPIGEGWDAHREAHVALKTSTSEMKGKTPVSRRPKSAPKPESRGNTERQTVIARQEKRQLGISPSKGGIAQAGTTTSGTRSRSGAPEAGGRTRGNSNLSYIPSREYVAGGNDAEETASKSVLLHRENDALQESDTDGNQRLRLSELLCLAIAPQQAYQILRERGFLPKDGQTRFANLFVYDRQ